MFIPAMADMIAKNVRQGPLIELKMDQAGKGAKSVDFGLIPDFLANGLFLNTLTLGSILASGSANRNYFCTFAP